jgi:hypothetical protein
MIVEVAGDDDVAAFAVRIIRRELVDDSADEERLRRAPDETAQVRLGVIARGDERHLPHVAGRFAEREAAVRLEVGSEDVDRAERSRVDPGADDPAAERNARPEGGRIARHERGEREVLGGVDLRFEDREAGDDRAANPARVGGPDDRLPVPERGHAGGELANDLLRPHFFQRDHVRVQALEHRAEEVELRVEMNARRAGGDVEEILHVVGREGKGHLIAGIILVRRARAPSRRAGGARVGYGEGMELPPEDDLRWIVARYAHLRAAHGDAIGEPSLVEPTGEFFPDAFSRSADGVATVLKRMLAYAPVAEGIGLELAFAEAEEGGGGGGCGSGACGTEGGSKGPVAESIALPEGAGYRLILPVRDVGEPVVLGAALARCVGGMILGEAGEEVPAAERLATAEIAATLSGFGVLLLAGSCVYTKSCGGLRAHQGTQLDVPSSAVALALFLRVHGMKPGAARRHLETTQREAFDEALRWVDSNAPLVDALRVHPASLADGVFAIEPVKGLFSRMFGAKPAALPESIAAPVSKRKVRSADEERRLAENRAIVEEALRRA